MSDKMSPCPVCKSSEKLILKDAKVIGDLKHRTLRVKCQNRACVTGPDSAKAIGPEIRYVVPDRDAAKPDAISEWNAHCADLQSPSDVSADVSDNDMGDF